MRLTRACCWCAHRRAGLDDGGCHVLAGRAAGPSVEIAEVRCAGGAPTCSVVFEEPRWAGQRVDSCLNWGQQCGAPAAAAFCQRMGYVGALGSTAALDIGGKEPTRILGDGKTCSDARCDGFAAITCGPVG